MAVLLALLRVVALGIGLSGVVKRVSCPVSFVRGMTHHILLPVLEVLERETLLLGQQVLCDATIALRILLTLGRIKPVIPDVDSGGTRVRRRPPGTEIPRVASISSFVLRGENALALPLQQVARDILGLATEVAHNLGGGAVASHSIAVVWCYLRFGFRHGWQRILSRAPLRLRLLPVFPDAGEVERLGDEAPGRMLILCLSAEHLFRKILIILYNFFIKKDLHFSLFFIHSHIKNSIIQISYYSLSV